MSHTVCDISVSYSKHKNASVKVNHGFKAVFCSILTVCGESLNSWHENWTLKVKITKKLKIPSSIYSKLSTQESEILVPNIVFTLSNYRKQFWMKSNQKRIRHNIDCHFRQVICIGKRTNGKLETTFVITDKLSFASRFPFFFSIFSDFGDKLQL